MSLIGAVGAASLRAGGQTRCRNPDVFAVRRALSESSRLAAISDRTETRATKSIARSATSRRFPTPSRPLPSGNPRRFALRAARHRRSPLRRRDPAALETIRWRRISRDQTRMEVSSGAAAIIARVFHFDSFTPLTRSQRQSESSPTNAGSRTAGNRRAAIGGERMTAAVFAR